MSDRVMSPVAAQAHARRAIRVRMKAQRMSKRVDSPAVFADRLLALAKDTAEAFPLEPSLVYQLHVQEEFSARFLQLCASHPVVRR